MRATLPRLPQLGSPGSHPRLVEVLRHVPPTLLLPQAEEHEVVGGVSGLVAGGVKGLFLKEKTRPFPN